MAVDALGASRVHGVMLPYKYTSNESLNDATATAEALHIRYDIMPIHATVEGLSKDLAKAFAGTTPDATEENLQSRARGTLLMAISNKFGPMVLTTGNKSEVSVGYATLYGDMNGGFNPIKDLYKGQVYALARYRNAARPKGCLGPEGIVIPENVLTKAPTAELRPGQRDQDTLPPYDVLDDILNCLVELEMPLPEIVARGHAPEVVRKVERMLYLAEYKRRQAAPGVKITAKIPVATAATPSPTNSARSQRMSVTVRFAPSPTGRLHAAISAPRCSIFCSRGRGVEASSSVSTTPTGSGRRRNLRAASTRTSPGSGSSGHWRSASRTASLFIRRRSSG
jgi:NAD+ synthetase